LTSLSTHFGVHCLQAVDGNRTQQLRESTPKTGTET